MMSLCALIGYAQNLAVLDRRPAWLLARRAGGLLDQLPDVILKDRDPIVEFRQRQGAFVTHDAFSRDSATLAPTRLQTYFAGSSTDT